MKAFVARRVPGHYRALADIDSEETAVFEATKTDIEFERDFVNKRADWLQNARVAEPDFDVDGLQQSLLSRMLLLLGLS